MKTEAGLLGTVLGLLALPLLLDVVLRAGSLFGFFCLFAGGSALLAALFAVENMAE